jgi:hypothetical protein
MNQTPNPPTEISPNSLKGRITPINMENRSKIKTPPPAPKKKPKNKKKKKKTHRCGFDGCRKKLNLVQQNKTCKCELMFCSKHFPFEDHNCSFDYKAFSKKKYETTVSLGGGSFTKVNII